MLWNIAVNDAGADYDPLTLLRSRTMFGRPDWKAIYSQMRQAIESGQYLPGATSQLKTKVGVSGLFSFMHAPSIDHVHPDVLLWAWSPCESHQRGNRRKFQCGGRLPVCEGALLITTILWDKSCRCPSDIVAFHLFYWCPIASLDTTI